MLRYSPISAARQGLRDAVGREACGLPHGLPQRENPTDPTEQLSRSAESARPARRPQTVRPSVAFTLTPNENLTSRQVLTDGAVVAQVESERRGPGRAVMLTRRCSGASSGRFFRIPSGPPTRTQPS